MKICFHGFWPDFLYSKHYHVFIQLFEKVFNDTIYLSNLNDSEVLVESVFSSDTLLYHKKWEYSFLFIGESTRRIWNNQEHFRKTTLKDYSCILKGEDNNKNIINFPLFVLYLYSYDFVNKLIKNEYINRVPEKDVCIIVSNSHDAEGRNIFFSELEKYINIDYAGNYKNNVPRIEHEHCTPEFVDFVSQYKFIITMENSKEEKYITEKILHGFAANTISVYWGSDYINEYFNEERFINVANYDINSINDAINKILFLKNNPEQYLEFINKSVYKNNELKITLDSIASDIQKLLHL
jgi:hypothetical protein